MYISNIVISFIVDTEQKFRDKGKGIMAIREELRQLDENIKSDFKQLYEKVKQYPLISLFFIFAMLLLIAVPHWQVSGINNTTVQATQENQDRTTLAQIFGGVAIGIGLYYTWRRINIAEKDLQATQENLKIAQDSLKVTQENLEATHKVAQDNLTIAREGQITERFTRAIDQLGNGKMEIRLGGIYALERISTESDKDYWPIMEILTAYVRKNSSVDTVENKKVVQPAINIQANESTTNEVPAVTKISLDIQAVLTVLGRRKNSFKNGESNQLNLRVTYLEGANLEGANLEGANLEGANLKEAILRVANLEGAQFEGANLEGAHLEQVNLTEADLKGVNLEKAISTFADFVGADLTGANLKEAQFPLNNFEGAYLKEANLKEANLGGTDLKRADLEGANLKEAILVGAENLTIYQLSKVKTLYNAKLDEKLEKPLREKYPTLFEEPK